MAIDRLRGYFIGQEGVIDEDFNKHPKLSREHAQRFSRRSRGSVRFSTGRFLTRVEWEDRRKKLLSRDLP